MTALGENIDDAVLRIERTYEVRGLLEHVTSHDSATVGEGAVVNDVLRQYNEFGQLVAEFQEHSGAVDVETTPVVRYGHADASANHIRRETMTYPNGRVLNYGYGETDSDDDLLSRVASLIDNDGESHLVDYTYLGLGTFVKVDYPEPSIRLDCALGAGDDPYDGLDRFGRVIDHRWLDYAHDADVVRIKHGYDRASNRLWREDPVAAANSVNMDELYAYDGLYQLKSFQRGQLNVAHDGLVTGTKTFAQQWSFDFTGNWSRFKEDNDGDGAWDLDQARTHDRANEITAISATTGPDWVDPVHDRAGNMTTLPQPTDGTESFVATWDAWNRLVALTDGESAIGDYEFDGLYRRTKKIVSDIPRHFFYSDEWNVLEQRLGSLASSDRQFIWGQRYIDDLVLRDRDGDSNPATGDFGRADNHDIWEFSARVLATLGAGGQQVARS